MTGIPQIGPSDLALPRLRDVVPSLRRALGRFMGAGVLPVVLFYVSFKLAGPLAGIACGMASSLIVLGVQAWRMGRLDPIVAIPMLVILANGTVAVLAGSAEIYLAAPAAEACIWGVVLVGSVLARRPLVPMIARELDVIPGSVAHSAGLRRSLEILTLAWGLAAFCKAGVRIWLLVTLDIETFLIAVTLAVAAINVVMMGLSVWLPFRMVRRPLDEPA